MTQQPVTFLLSSAAAVPFADDGLDEALYALNSAYRDEIDRVMHGALTAAPATLAEWLVEAQRIVLQRLVLIDWIAQKKALSLPLSAQSSAA